MYIITSTFIYIPFINGLQDEHVQLHSVAIHELGYFTVCSLVGASIFTFVHGKGKYDFTIL